MMSFAAQSELTAQPRKRRISGVFLLDKPAGITSQTAVLKVKRLFAADKAGHTGTLDPLATGLLPICFGEATKFSSVLSDADKTYVATVKLGITTTTGDMEGDVTARAPVAVERAVVVAVLSRFTGEVIQTPPMYSAVKFAGTPLYKYARAGIELARAPRKVSIRTIELAAVTHDELRIRVTCSKGTYIRVLAEDIGRALDCGACLAALRRTAAGEFEIEAAIDMDALYTMAPDQRDSHLLPVDSLVAALPRVDLDAAQAQKIATGRTVESPRSVPPGLVSLYGPTQEYMGIATMEAPGTIVPRRLMTTATDAA
jgi:tRNA pseudouridine55 synthase